MSVYAAGTLPWTVSEEDEARFRKILKWIVPCFVFLSVLWPWLPVPKIDRRTEEIPPRLAKLVLEHQAPPKMLEVPPVPETGPAKTEAKPEQKVAVIDATERIEAARQKASRAGLLAFKGDLADLRDSATAAKLNNELNPDQTSEISAPGAKTRQDARSILSANAAKDSGGIAVSTLGQDTGGTGLAAHSTTQMNDPAAAADGEKAAGGELRRGGGAEPGRSLEEIRLVFDRNKGAIYALYNRALRDAPTLQGKVVLKLTIAPSGQVTDCQIVASELRSPDLERKLVVRIKQFDFGAKDVDIVVVTYPIDFLPS